MSEGDMGTRVSSRTELEAIYREHGNRFWWAVLAYCGDRDVASDAVAEAFAQALRRDRALTDPLAWVWRTAFRVAAGELHRRRRSQQLGVEQAYEMPEPTDLFLALARLSPRQRAAVVLFHYGDYRLTEIADILGIAKATVSVHLVRGRRRLRQLLEDRHE
jgi:RNA polymerase sigma-70 factor, ECF subfamily